METKKLRMTLGLTSCLQNVIDKKAIVSGTAYPVSIKEIEVQTVETQALA